jgi:NADH-quinone oxidoreductase subunit M
MAAFAGCGLPGFANFAGEVTVFFGAWKSFRLVTVLACWGALIIGAIYMLRAIRSVLHGSAVEKWSEVKDAPHAWRRAPFVCLAGCLLLFGFFPRLLTDKIQPSVEPIIARFPNASATQANLDGRPKGIAGLPLPSLIRTAEGQPQRALLLQNVSLADQPAPTRPREMRPPTSN